MKGDCPCGSGAPYKTCCKPLHAGEREAATCEALMRSRYAAFATREVAYLVRTLAPEHEDRALPEAELARALSTNARALKFTGLAVLDAREDGDRGEVAFLARVYEKGQDRSFVERSEFRREGGAWRYVGALEEPRPPTDAERARLR